ncbi:MAG: DEAD/DEAH box helicase [Synechococcales bacterium]|nr:DEAD/DEAH box helicase [Synechococcales bacterium]
MTTSTAPFGLDPTNLYSFPLDNFQLEAIAALDGGRSVVVCAPTGSGKTLVGEYAIHRALARGKRVFYTTPLKALSNQKLRDFRDQFGAEEVGLLTGDVSINRDAPILVMTTEIFRNMLYGTPIGEVGTSLIGVETVVLDECHYMNDRQRGTVWEESIIYCPPTIQLVALSATVANSDQLTDWITQIHGPTDLIYSDFRPVPLEFLFANPKGVFPLLDESGKRMNPRLRPKAGKFRPRGANQRGAHRPEPPSLTMTLSKLRQHDMLPAIYFIFSRKGCDRALMELSEVNFVTPEERHRIQKAVDEYALRSPEAVREAQIEPLLRGLASHHAGLLPAWKMLVEELFQQGLIKVVFATETLAAGINMPARTTVISNLSKRTDTGHRLLTGSEFLQMAGRAGRRGMDRQGYVVLVQTPFETVREAFQLATSGADPLISQFAPSYGMVLNLLQTHTLEETRELVERSFAQYLATYYLRPQQKQIDQQELELTLLQERMAAVDWKLVEQYEKLQERMKEERRLLKTLQKQAAELAASQLMAALPFAIAGSHLILKADFVQSGRPLPAVLVAKVVGMGESPYLVCLGQDNRWYVVTVAQVIALCPEIPRLVEVDHLSLPSQPLTKSGQSLAGTEETLAIAQRITHSVSITSSKIDLGLISDSQAGMEEQTQLLAPEVYAQLQRMKGVLVQLENHPVHQWSNRSKIFKYQRRMEALEDDIRDRKEKLGRQTQRNWQEFLGLVEILQEFGALDGLQPTRLGQATAAIRGDNELWLGLAVMSGELDDLDPHHLATVCAGLVTEISRPDSWTRYGISPTVLEVLGGFRSLRRQLFQHQRRRDVMQPIWLEDEMVGLVEQWALGTEWLELCSNTSLDEGDLVRILRRILDFLSQIPHVPHADRKLKENALRAIQLIDRFPINEEIE